MEPPDEWYGFESEPMNEHYSKEHAWEQMIGEARGAMKKARVSDVDDFVKRYGYDQMRGRKKQMLATKESNYEAMWPLVHAICESLQYESDKWQFFENRFKHRENGCEFWCHGMISPVTETFMMGEGGSDKVFNRAQGEAILEAVKIARVEAPTELQKKLLKGFGLVNEREVIDERHVIHVPRMTFWQRLLFLVTARCKVS